MICLLKFFNKGASGLIGLWVLQQRFCFNQCIIHLSIQYTSLQPFPNIPLLSRQSMSFKQPNLSPMQTKQAANQSINDSFNSMKSVSYEEQDFQKLMQNPQTKASKQALTQGQNVQQDKIEQKKKEIQKAYKEIQLSKTEKQQKSMEPRQHSQPQNLMDENQQSSVANLNSFSNQESASMSSQYSRTQNSHSISQNQTENNSRNSQSREQSQHQSQSLNSNLTSLNMRRRPDPSDLYDDSSLLNSINDQQIPGQIKEINEISIIQIKQVEIQPQQKIFTRIFHQTTKKRQEEELNMQQQSAIQFNKQVQQFIKDFEGSQQMRAYNNQILQQIRLIRARFPQIYKDLVIIFQDFHPKYSKQILYKLRQRLKEIKNLQSFFPADILQQIKQEFKNSFIYTLDLQNIYSLDKQQKIRHKERILNMNLLGLVELKLGFYSYSDNQFSKLIHHLSDSKVLRSLCLQKTTVNSLKFQYFIDYSEKFTKLIEIYFDKNQICDQGFIKFVDKAQNFSYLRIAMFSQNMIENKGLNYFIQNRHRFKKLRDIALDGNQITNLSNKQLLYNQNYWNTNFKNKQFFRFNLMRNPLDKQSYSAIFQFISYLREKQITTFDIYIDPQVIKIQNQNQFNNYIAYYRRDKEGYHHCNQAIALKKIKQLNMQQYKLQILSIAPFLINLDQLESLESLKINIQQLQNYIFSPIFINNHLFQLTERRQGRQKRKLTVDISKSKLSKEYKNLLFRIYTNDPYVSFSYVQNSQDAIIHQKRKSFVELKLQIMKLIWQVCFTSPKYSIEKMQQICKNILQKIKKLIIQQQNFTQKVVHTIKNSYLIIQKGCQGDRRKKKSIDQSFEQLFIKYAQKIEQIKEIDSQQFNKSLQQIQKSYDKQLKQKIQFAINQVNPKKKQSYFKQSKYYDMNYYDDLKNNLIKQTLDLVDIQPIQQQTTNENNERIASITQPTQSEQILQNDQNQMILSNQMNSSDNGNYQFSRIIQDNDEILKQLN